MLSLYSLYRVTSEISSSDICNVYKQKTHTNNVLLSCGLDFRPLTINIMSLFKFLSESYTRHGVIFLSHPHYSRYNKLSQPHSLPVSDCAGSVLQ